MIPWTAACPAPPSMEFSRQEYWSGLPFPSPGDLPNPGIKPRSPALQADSLPTELSGKRYLISRTGRYGQKFLFCWIALFSVLCVKESRFFGELCFVYTFWHFWVSGFSKPSWVTQNKRGKENTNQTSLLGCSCIAEKKMCNVSCQLHFGGAK